MQPTCDRRATDVQPTCDRRTTDIRPTYGHHTKEGLALLDIRTYIYYSYIHMWQSQVENGGVIQTAITNGCGTVHVVHKGGHRKSGVISIEILELAHFVLTASYVWMRYALPAVQVLTYRIDGSSF